MKKIIKSSLVNFFDPFAKKIGFVREGDDVVEDTHNRNPLLSNFYNILTQINYTPKHIVDVGANHGTWTREALRYFPDASYTLLEPQYWLKESIKDLLETNPRIKFNAVGAGENEGTFMFTIVDRDDSCSFKYTPDEARANGFKQIEVPVVTLNNLLPATGLPAPDIIKIDAEGLDLEVLKGATNYLGKTEIFMLEASVGNKSFDNSFLKVINFMDKSGYRLFEITDLNRPFNPGILWLVELAFVKKEGIIDANPLFKF